MGSSAAAKAEQRAPGEEAGEAEGRSRDRRNLLTTTSRIVSPPRARAPFGDVREKTMIWVVLS